MGVEPTFLPPFPNPALGVHDHRRPRLESAHPSEVGAASDTGAGQELRHRESVFRFSELAQALRDWPLEFLADIAVLESEFGTVGFSDTGVRNPSDATPIGHYPDCTPCKVAWSPTRAAVLLSIPAFAQNSAGLPPTFGHQFGRPQAPDALPSSLIGMRAMSRGIQGRHQPSTTFASSPDSAGSSSQWSKAIVTMTSTDELRPGPNPVR